MSKEYEEKYKLFERSIDKIELKFLDTFKNRTPPLNKLRYYIIIGPEKSWERTIEIIIDDRIQGEIRDIIRTEERKIFS